MMPERSRFCGGSQATVRFQWIKAGGLAEVDSQGRRAFRHETQQDVFRETVWIGTTFRLKPDGGPQELVVGLHQITPVCIEVLNKEDVLRQLGEDIVKIAWTAKRSAGKLGDWIHILQEIFVSCIAGLQSVYHRGSQRVGHGEDTGEEGGEVIDPMGGGIDLFDPKLFEIVARVVVQIDRPLCNLFLLFEHRLGVIHRGQEYAYRKIHFSALIAAIIDVTVLE